jgi:hypothetical protein
MIKIRGMNKLTSFFKFLILFGAVGLFLIVNNKSGPQRSALQVAFDGWLHQLKLVLDSEVEQPRPAVKIELQSTYPELQAAWTLTTAGGADLERKVLRLLELTSEANIFSLPAPKRDNGPLVTLVVEEGSHRFMYKFEKTSIDGSVAAQSLFKLFQLYANQNQQPNLAQQ